MVKSSSHGATVLGQRPSTVALAQQRSYVLKYMLKAHVVVQPGCKSGEV